MRRLLPFKQHAASHLTFDMRGAQKAQPFGHPLDGRVRRQCATNALPSARKEEFIGSSGALPKMRAGPSESALQGQASNHLKLLRSKAVVVSVEAKGAPLSASGVVREDERK